MGNFRQKINSENSAKIIIIIFVISQFLSIDLLIIKGFVFSLQKVLAIVFFPFAIAGFGRKSIIFQKKIILYSVLYFATFSFAYIIKWDINSRLLLACLSTGMNAVIAVLFFSALMVYKNAYEFLGKIWISVAAVIALLTFGQFHGIFPDLFNNPVQYYIIDGEYYFRGAGTLQDPNYMAGLFLVAIGFVLGLKKLRFKLPLVIALTLGILGTISRMGLLGLFLALCVSPFYLQNKNNNWWYRFSFILIILLGTSFFLVFPTGASQVIFSRISDSNLVLGAIREVNISDNVEVLKSLSPNGGVRLLMLEQGLRGFIDNIWFGIGGYNSANYILSTLGVSLVLHNTYLEFMLAGGLIGVMFLAYFFFITVKSVLLNHPQSGAVLLQVLVFYFVGLFLGFDTDFYMWSVFVLSVWLIESNRKMSKQSENTLPL